MPEQMTDENGAWVSLDPVRVALAALADEVDQLAAEVQAIGQELWPGPVFDCDNCKWDTNEEVLCKSPRKDELGCLAMLGDGLDGCGAPCPGWEPKEDLFGELNN